VYKSKDKSNTKPAQTHIQQTISATKFKQYIGNNKSAKEVRALAKVVDSHNKTDVNKIVLNLPTPLRDDRLYTIRVKYSIFGNIEKIIIKEE